jgi:hypothetical protein
MFTHSLNNTALTHYVMYVLQDKQEINIVLYADKVYSQVKANVLRNALLKNSHLINKLVPNAHLNVLNVMIYMIILV